MATTRKKGSNRSAARTTAGATVTRGKATVKKTVPNSKKGSAPSAKKKPRTKARAVPRTTLAREPAADTPSPLLKRGSYGPAVALWRDFLRSQQSKKGMLPKGETFDSAVDAATRAFQAQARLQYVDGIVGPETWWAAYMMNGELKALIKELTYDEDPDYPLKPDDKKRMTSVRRAALFGTLEYTPDASLFPNDPDRIVIAPVCMARIKPVKIPQLIGVPGARDSGEVWFHEKAHQNLKDLFARWQEAGMLGKVLSFDGAFAPRFKRLSGAGVRENDEEAALSNHAFGLAFDINAGWNMLDHLPARRHERGCVYDLVPLAYDCGFYWGGHIASRLDGMHFEIADPG